MFIVRTINLICKPNIIESPDFYYPILRIYYAPSNSNSENAALIGLTIMYDLIHFINTYSYKLKLEVALCKIETEMIEGSHFSSHSSKSLASNIILLYSNDSH